MPDTYQMTPDQMRAEIAELHSLRDLLSSLLRRAAVALKGPEPPLTSWGWHDLPERVAEMRAEIERLTAERDALLRQALEALDIFQPDMCLVVHHAKHDRHSLSEPCPVVARHHDAIATLRAAMKDKP